MRMRCAVRNCGNNNKEKPCTISFFSFPSDGKLIKQWRSFCGRGKELNAKTAKICMEHFKSEDYENELQYKLDFTKRRILKSGAVPSVNKLSAVDDEREKRKQKRENKRIVEMLIKEHDEKNVAPKGNLQNEPSVQQPMITEIVAKPKFSTVSDLKKEDSLKTTYDMEYYKMEIERLRTENNVLKETSKKQEAKFIAIEKEREKSNEKYESNIRALKTQLTKANYALYNLEEKLLGIFTKGQIAKLKGGDKRRVWSDEDLSQGLTLYEASPKLYKLLYRKRFPLPSVRTVQLYRRKGLDKEIIQELEIELQQDVEEEVINEALEEEINVDIDEEINEDFEIYIKEELEDRLTL